jgi:hypothetical protein
MAAHGGLMSRINGDKARYQKNRKRTLKTRERTRALVAKLKDAGKTKSAKA